MAYTRYVKTNWIWQEIDKLNYENKTATHAGENKYTKNK